MNFKEQLLKNHILAYSIGLIYLWFGLLKYFPGWSPAEELAKSTINILDFGILPSEVSIILLAIWETVIGLFLILNIYRRFTIILAMIHMICTFAPLVLFPDQSFVDSPFVFTLVGQYIFKNLIIICALLTLYKLHQDKNERYSK